MKKNIETERIRARDDAAQILCWCIIIALNQNEGIGAMRLERACREMKTFEDSYRMKIRATGRRKATEAMQDSLEGICDFDVILPRLKFPKNRREEQIRMAENEGARIAWLVMAAAVHSTFGFGKDRLARLKKESLENYSQYVGWENEAGKDYALEQIRRCASAAIGEELFVNDCTSAPDNKLPKEREIDPAIVLKISSVLSSRKAQRSGVKKVPLMVMSEAAAQKEIAKVARMNWKDIK